jgi:hypothetical protein
LKRRFAAKLLISIAECSLLGKRVWKFFESIKPF